MTPTRKYYNSLIDLFECLCKIQEKDTVDFLKIKGGLFDIITRIKRFNLFDLTFTDHFFSILTKDKITDFSEEKIALVSELYYELRECLDTKRLRYGGELMQYLLKLEIIFLQLNIKEIDMVVGITKSPSFFISTEQKYDSERLKGEVMTNLRKTLNSYHNNKDKTKISKKQYQIVEDRLQEYLSEYKKYVFENYKSIEDKFSFYNKRVIAYIIQAMPKDIFEFRIHSYVSSSGDISLTLRNQYYDFYPSYFYNLEEISDPLYSANVISLNKNDFYFDNPFSIKKIHYELFTIFLRSASEKEVEGFVTFLYKCKGYSFKDKESSNDGWNSLEASQNGVVYFIRVFHHQHRSAHRVLDVVSNDEKLLEMANNVYVFTSYPGDNIISLLKKNNIGFAFLDDMVREQFSVENSIIVHWYIRSKLPELKPPVNIVSYQFEGDSLITRIAECPLGEKNWVEFESIGIDVFKYLFADNFKKYLANAQAVNSSRSYRRDLLVNNNAIEVSSFWTDVKTQFNASAITVEFKNHSKKLTSETLYNATKYINKNIGNFVIILSRKGIDSSAKQLQQELFRQGKLIITIDDEEIKEMIREKIIGKDPIDRLETKKFELLSKT